MSRPGASGSGRWIALIAFLCAGGVLQLFKTYDWNRGVARALLLVVLGAIVLALRRVGPLSFTRPEPWGRAFAAAALAALLGNLYQGARTIQHSAATGEIELDQGQNSFRAVRFLLAGINPYGRRTMLDPSEYFVQTGRWAARVDCVRYSRPAMLQAQRSFWDTGAPEGMEGLYPAIAPGAACAPVRQGFDTLGFKYGPVTVLGYLPFVGLFGEAGIYVDHLLAFLALLGVLGFLAWRTGGGNLFLAALPALLVLVPSHYRHNVLVLSASDLTPVLLGLTFLALARAGRPHAAAVALALSIGAKILPGLLFAPLLLKAPRSSWATFAAALLAVFVPFAAWDAQGLWNNIFLYNLGRSTDSTALAHFLPSGVALLMTLAVVALLAVLVVRVHRAGWPELGTLRYLAWAHIGVLVTGKIFHNNYLLWLIPILGLAMLAELRARAAPAPAPARPGGGRGRRRG